MSIDSKKMELSLSPDFIAPASRKAPKMTDSCTKCGKQFENANSEQALCCRSCFDSFLSDFDDLKSKMDNALTRIAALESGVPSVNNTDTATYGAPPTYQLTDLETVVGRIVNDQMGKMFLAYSKEQAERSHPGVARGIVITKIPESNVGKDLETAAQILETAQVQDAASKIEEVYRMGKAGDRPRLLKVVLKEGVNRADIASKGPNLKNTAFDKNKVRVSMTSRQRQVFRDINDYYYAMEDEERSKLRVRVDYFSGEPSLEPFKARGRATPMDSR